MRDVIANECRGADLAGAQCDDLLQPGAPFDRLRDDARCAIGGIRPETGRQQELEPVSSDVFGARIPGLDDAAYRHAIEVEMPALTVVLRAQRSAPSRNWNGASLPGEPPPQCIERRGGRAMRVGGAGEAAKGDGDTVSPLASFVPTGEPRLAMLGQEDVG